MKIIKTIAATSYKFATPAVWSYETADDFAEHCANLDDCADAVALGIYRNAAEILDELSYNGIGQAQAVRMSNVIYGHYLEIVAHGGRLAAYVGTR